jgi:hypothetical protein
LKEIGPSNKITAPCIIEWTLKDMKNFINENKEKAKKWK